MISTPPPCARWPGGDGVHRAPRRAGGRGGRERPLSHHGTTQLIMVCLTHTHTHTHTHTLLFRMGFVNRPTSSPISNASTLFACCVVVRLAASAPIRGWRIHSAREILPAGAGAEHTSLPPPGRPCQV